MSARVLSALTMLCLGGPLAVAAEDYEALLDEAVANGAVAGMLLRTSGFGREKTPQKNKMILQ